MRERGGERGRETTLGKRRPPTGPKHRACAPRCAARSHFNHVRAGRVRKLALLGTGKPHLDSSGCGRCAAVSPNRSAVRFRCTLYSSSKFAGRAATSAMSVAGACYRRGAALSLTLVMTTAPSRPLRRNG